MWQTIGWIIWGILALLAVWGVFINRKQVKSGQDFNFSGGMVILFVWIIAVLFLVFGWNKLHILWVLPIALFSVPFFITEKIPAISSLTIFLTKVFGGGVLVGIEIEPFEEEEEGEDWEDENDEVEEDNEKSQIIEQNSLERYKRIRKVGRNLTGQMMKHAPKFAITKTASDLNLRGPKGILVFDEESDTPFMMDRCFYDIFWDGKNLISHFIESDDYKQLTEEEQAIVQAMTTAYYSLFEITNVNPSESTLELKDLLSQETYTITDLNLSRTAHTEYLLAARIHQPEGIFMTTGAVCPFEVEQRQNLLDGLEPRKISVGKKKKTKRLQRSDYSAYFFKQYKRIEGIKVMTVDEME